MKRTTLRNVFVLSSGCLLAVAGQAQEQDDGFSFSADAFEAPAAPPEPIYDSYVEGGIGYSSDDSYRFGRYNGLTDEGAFLNGAFRYLKRGEWDGDDLSYIEATGENLGLENRRLKGAGGVQGKYKLFLNYQEIPYYDFKSQTPYRGVGSESLSLPPDWESNSRRDYNTATQNLPQLSTSLETVRMKTKRKDLGGGFSWDFDENWSARLSAEREKKTGKKPLGVAWGTNGQTAAAVVVPEPVDYRTDRVDAEVGYRDRKMQFRFAYELSQFDNKDSTLQVENPFTYAGWPPASSYPNGTAQMDLPPDNTAHMLNLSGGYNFSDVTRLTANLGYSRYRQDDRLLPYTGNASLNVQDGVPRTHADAKASNVIGNVELYSRPVKEVDYKLRYRYTDRDNDTPKNLFVYVAGDAENQQTGGNQIRYRYNTSSDLTEHLVSGDVGYRPRSGTRLSLGYEYRDTDRTYSERSSNDQQTATLGARHRFSPELSVNAEYAHTWRRGSSYDGASTLLDSYTPAYTESLGDAAFINHPDLRMYHLADMDRDKASARLTFAPNDALILGGRVSYIQDDYNESTLGLTDVEGWGVSLDGSYRISEDLTVNGFYAYDDRSTDQAGWSFYGGADKLAQSQDPDRRWWVTNDYDIHTLGAGLDWKATPKLRLSADYVYVDATAKTRAKGGDALDSDELGAFPDQPSRTNTLRVEMGYDLSKQTTLGLTYLYEDFDTSDWQTDDVAPDTIGRVLSLEEYDPDYDNNVIMTWARFKF